ncbi:MAG: diadenylate cyclase [Lentisphaerae bacterium]|jgi:diadenylate cyclase|nr:diadenylate cyclase [Lentisphaerota bacterium]
MIAIADSRFYNILSQLQVALLSAADCFSLSAIVQVAILYIAIYSILKSAKGTRFGQALLGVGVLAAIFWSFPKVLHFDVLYKIVQGMLIYLAISTVVIFQPEIRRFLATVGALSFFEKPKHRPDGAATPELVTETVLALAREKMGALIAFERGISLRSHETTGVKIDSLFSLELVRTIFTPPLPLHDGGMVIRDGRISSAHCIFPVSSQPELSSSGMRHRAAVGLSEETDALVVVVSEERGSVSVAHNGKINRYSLREAETQLQRWIEKAMPDSEGDRGLVGFIRTTAHNLVLKLHGRRTEGGGK